MNMLTRKNAKTVSLEIFIICFLALLFLPASASSERLDFSGNGVVDLSDVVVTLKAATDDSVAFTAGIDVNGDNKIGIPEAVYLINILSGNIINPYEAGDTADKAGLIITDGLCQYHNFHDAGDEDWLKFSAIWDQTYLIEVKNPGTRCDPVIELYDTDGETKKTSSNYRKYGKDERLVWKCEKSGTYYLKITNADSGVFGEDTEYNLCVSLSDGTDPDGGEDDDTFDKANFIPLSEDQRHNFHKAEDADWVVFYVMPPEPPNTVIPYTIKVRNPESRCDAVIALYDDPESEHLKQVDDAGSGENEMLKWNFAQEGFYYLKITNAGSDIFGKDTAYDLYVYISEAAVPPRGAIVGYVFDAASDNFMETIIKEVSITMSDGKKIWYSDLLGLYYAYGLEKGTYFFTAEAEGYEDASCEVEVGSSMVVKDIWMTPQVK
jgi:hypothetical protein